LAGQGGGDFAETLRGESFVRARRVASRLVPSSSRSEKAGWGPWESGPEGWWDGRWGTRPGGKRQRAREGPACASGIPFVGRRPIELILGDGLRSREVEGRGLVEVEFGLGRAACGGHAGGPRRQVKMEEDALHGIGERDEGDDAHLPRPRFARCPVGHKSGSTSWARARSWAQSLRLERDGVTGRLHADQDLVGHRP